MSCKISVYNIDYEASNEEIRQFFELIGPLREEPNIKREDNTQNRGKKVTAEVIYLDAELAQCAFKNLNSKKLKDREVKIRYQDEDKIRKAAEDEKEKDFCKYLEQLGKQDKLFLMQELKNLMEANRPLVLTYMQKNTNFLNSLLKIQTELGINQHQTVIQEVPKIQGQNPIFNQIRQDMRNTQVPPPKYQQPMQQQQQHMQYRHNQQNLQPNMISKQNR